MTRNYVKVQVAGSYADCDVPTKEEYDDFKRRISERLEIISSHVTGYNISACDRLTTLEAQVTALGGTEDALITKPFNIYDDQYELTGTEKQHQVFDTLIKQRWHSQNILPEPSEVADIAWNAGLSIKLLKS